MMKPDKILEDLLSLLAVTIIADKRVFAAEIDTFIRATSKLPVALELEPKLSEARLLQWYEMNKADLQDKVEGPYFKTWFYECLDRLRVIKDKPAVLKVVSDIAVSDGEKHVSERALITLAARYWGVEFAH